MPRHSKTLTLLAAALLLPLGATAANASRVAPQAAQAKAAELKAAKKQAADCDETTASRIRRTKAGECRTPASPTRSFTKEEIDQTGQTDVGEALKRLDPRFH